MSKGFISPPSLSQGSHQDLNLESTLRELPLYEFQVTTSCLGEDIAHMFERYPLLPGAILEEDGRFAGIFSRRQLLDYLIRPHRLELFLHKPISALYSYIRSQVLILPDSTPILTATYQALRRSSELVGEPVVVQVAPSSYRLLDAQELNIASWQIRGIETQVRYERTQAQMIQIEKMASLGRLVDGVAHEILDPVSFIWGNLSHVSTYSQQLIELLSAYETHLSVLPPDIAMLKTEIEADFLQQDMPRALASIRAGAERLKNLGTSLQNFCHIDEVYPKPADLHACLDSIILLLKSRLTNEIEIIRNYGQLPPVQCYIGQLNQVFMNIITNAIDALINSAIRRKFAQDFGRLEQQNCVHKPRIEIITQVFSRNTNNSSEPNSRWVSICVADNGSGMSAQKQQQILESFSVKKRTAKETSLSVSYQIITAKHGGEFYVRSPSRISTGISNVAGDQQASSQKVEESPLGSGTEFEIVLPLI